MYDVAFISYNEPNAISNYIKLLTSFPYNRIIKIDGVKGIHQAHIEAAKRASTSMFYVVDADADLVPEFKFDIRLSPEEEDIVHVLTSRNPVNQLEYGYGGVKLLPRQLTLDMDTSKPDMTTSISSRFKPMKEVSNITKFNTDPLSTWRSSFRECAKLASRIIDGQIDIETEDRLRTWQYNQSSELFAEYSRGGASAGAWYGSTYKNDPEFLSKINDWSWLEFQFKEHVKMFPPETFK